MAEIKIFSPDTLGKPLGQYSQITRVKASEFVYIAGQLAADRDGKVMLDPSRNHTGATVVAAYSPRARDEATVSFPVVAGELRRTDPSAFTIETVPKLLDRKGPRAWSDAEREPLQRIPRALLLGK